MQVFSFISTHQAAAFLSSSRAVRLSLYYCMDVVFYSSIDSIKSGYG